MEKTSLCVIVAPRRVRSRALNSPAWRSGAALLLFAVLCLLAPGQSRAAPDLSKQQEFRLEAQPLFQAVAEWADQSRFQVSFQPGSVALSDAPKVIGRLSPADALLQLLAGTGLTYKLVDSLTVLILPATAGAGTKPAGRTSAPETSVAAVSAENGIKRSSEPIAEVLVTGTHILGVAPAGSAVITLDKDEIRRLGYATTEQAVQWLTQNIRSGTNGESADARFSAGAAASGNVSFGASANLRGLGSTATLTLVNGHRVAPSGQGLITDISLIPLAAVSRIEVLTDGASAVYGADAIAGVVNIILKDDFDEAETHVRYGFTSPAGRNETHAWQSLGSSWDRGSVLGVASVLSQSALRVDKRACTSGVARPASIFPSNEQLSVHVSGRQQLADSWVAHADVQHGRTQRFAVGTASQPGHLEFPATIDRTQGSMSLRYAGIEGWDLWLRGHLSREGTDFSFLHFPTGESVPQVSSSEVQGLTQGQWITGLAANGILGSLPAGSMSVAVGIDHREEEYTRSLRSPTIGSQHVARTVESAYVELHVPLFGEPNRAPDARGARLSLAGRYDDYSDVGHIVNPKLGLSWAPVSGLELRATYSHSFRAPAPGAELIRTSHGTDALVSIYSFRSADSSETIPVAFLTGATNLRPETARHWTAGLTLHPNMIEGLKLDLTYYAISYSGRIVAPPFDSAALSNPALQSFIRSYSSPAALQTALARQTGGQLVYVDRTGTDSTGGAFGPNPQNLATYIYDARLVNASVLDTDGIDLTVGYSTRMRGGQLDLSLTTSAIHELETTFAPGAQAFDSVGTVGNPAGLKLRAGAVFTRGRWEGGLAVNFTNGYRDTTPEPDVPVSSYGTTDAYLSYTFHNSRARTLDDLSIRLGVSNLFDEGPPRIAGSRATRGATYDAANADPLGRLIAIEFSLIW
ncbi:TonB-dependent receptor domain-containing protein [Steroidobacter flavus]|uniref:TonB-dependent receptor domain-containing protein n=1 Tax=Steroidobacter flavus TaxID=1842136 RepID=A0ABV8SQE3_9GAMM